MLNKLDEYQDCLAELNQKGTLQEKLISVHEVITATFEFVDRIAVAVYNRENDCLKTFIASPHLDDPLTQYEARLSESPSLCEILQRGHPRVVNNLDIFRGSQHAHARRISEMKYVASYTMPVYHNGHFYGFVFFNSMRRDVFEDHILHQMDLFGHMISLMVMNELNTAHTLSAALKTTGDIVKHRDPTTGTHIDRMSRYAELIARSLAERYDLNDEYIQYVYLFSPLHDIGKVGIPDQILQKTGQLTDEEFRTMQRHTVLGRELIDRLLDNFGLDGFRYADVLRNIAQYHHEAVNGSGYPEGLAGGDIPLEARIVAVADVFDALTSRRPYKPAWSNGKALKVLQQMADSQLDHDCVNALIHHHDEIERIQREFSENVNL